MGQALSCSGGEQRTTSSPLSIKQRDQLLVEFKDISAELVPEKMIARTIDAILHLLPVERASVFICDRAAGVMRTFNEVDVETEPTSMRDILAGGPDALDVAPSVRTITIPIDKGIAGSVVASGKVLMIADAHKDPRFDSSVDKETGFYTRNLVTVPVKLSTRALDEVDRQSLKRSKTRALPPSNESGTRGTKAADRRSVAGGGVRKEEEVVAVLQALNHDGHFSKHDVSVLEFIAMLLAGVLARSALVDEAVREKSKATALLKVAEAVNSSETSRMKAMKVMGAVKLGVDCERAAFVLVDEVHNEQVLFSIDSDSAGLRFSTSAGVTGACITTAAPIIIPDAYADSRFNKEADAATGFVTRDIVAVPVIRGGGGPPRVIAVIEGVNARRGRFDEEQVQVMQTIALQVADRLMPSLIQDMVEASSLDHGLEEAEVERVKAMLTSEFALPKPDRVRKAQSHFNDVLHESFHSRKEGSTRRGVYDESRLITSSSAAAADAAASSSAASTPSGAPGTAPSRSGTGTGPNTIRMTAAVQRSWLGDMLGTGSFPSLPVLSEGVLFTRPRGMSEAELVHWDLDILAFDTTELMQLTAAIFQQSGVLETFGISGETLAHFIAAIGGRYHANPYHNFNHGVHVLLGSWLLARDELKYRGKQSFSSKGASLTERSNIQKTSFHNVESLEPLHVLALLIAAVGHDVDHPGVNNAFMCASNSALAMRYNDVSVLENHHASTTFEILAVKRCNMLGTITADQRKEVRALMIAAILATDMAHHQAMVKELSVQASDTTSAVTVAFTMRVLCHVADLGNCAIKCAEPLPKRPSSSLARAFSHRLLARPPRTATPRPHAHPDRVRPRLGFIGGSSRRHGRSACATRPSTRPTRSRRSVCRVASSRPTLTTSSRLASWSS